MLAAEDTVTLYSPETPVVDAKTTGALIANAKDVVAGPVVAE